MVDKKETSKTKRKPKPKTKPKAKNRNKHIDNPDKIITGKKGRPIEWTPKMIEDLADSMMEFYAHSDAFLLKEFAVYADVPSDYIFRFAGENEHFSRAYKRCKDLCEIRLAREGKGADKPTFIMFCLKCNYDWKESQVIEHKGNRIITVDIEDDDAEGE